ncbi:MAG: hypothetical protein KatS3mg057_0116 [Herpetosiphonaceae bacterium]|nr:MAG: hypothetical protein KatS3mg057_0116 [Herpetosiphonaceae bacterium]
MYYCAGRPAVDKDDQRDIRCAGIALKRDRCYDALGIFDQQRITALQELVCRSNRLGQEAARIIAQIENNSCQPCLADVAQRLLQLIRDTSAERCNSDERDRRLRDALPCPMLQLNLPANERNNAGFVRFRVEDREADRRASGPEDILNGLVQRPVAQVLSIHCQNNFAGLQTSSLRRRVVDGGDDHKLSIPHRYFNADTLVCFAGNLMLHAKLNRRQDAAVSNITQRLHRPIDSAAGQPGRLDRWTVDSYAPPAPGHWRGRQSDGDRYKGAPTR